MVSLRRKLAFSYGLLILIILALSAWGVYNFARLGRIVDVILINNYQSIIAAEDMKEALEREDSAAQFFIAGEGGRARQQFAANAEKFTAKYEVAANNITEPGEDKIVADIDAGYRAYAADVERFINRPAGTPVAEPSQYYFQHLEPAFDSLKGSLDDLLHLNQQAMVAAKDRAAAQSWRAAISAAAGAALALLVALVFAWRFTGYIVDPITVLTEKAKRIGEGEFDQPIDLGSEDEIGVLASEFNRMATRLRDLRQSDYWRMQIERKKSDAVIDAIYEPVIVTDARGRVTKLNRAASDLFGKPGGESEDDDVSLSEFGAGDRILSAVQTAVTMQRPVAAEGEAALVPVTIGGAERSYQLRTTPMRDADGRLIGAVTLLEDITQIREVDRIKTEFISVASGKLREPLHSLQLALHTLIEGYVGEFTDKQMELLYAARQGADQLEDLMSDLLDLAEIESGARQISTERLRPAELARSALERFNCQAECKHIKLESRVYPDLPWVVADRGAVKTVLDNLLANAIRHTDRDGEVTIGAVEGDGRVFFSVHDSGHGIPEQYLPNLFHRFVKVDGKAEGGTGLGLALVKRLVEAQGGQVRVESRVGEGSTFTFTLPVGGPASIKAVTSEK